MDKVCTVKAAISQVKSGMTVMIGGFGGIGNPPTLIQAMLDHDIDDLTVICNDAGFPEVGVGRLVTLGKVKKLIATHIGSNPNAGKKMNEGEMEVIFYPQGTLAEKIRAGGVGLGGVLLDVGIDGMVQEGKEVVQVQEKPYMIESALTADVSVVYAKKADKFGNLVYDKSARNTNPLMAMAGNITIAEVEEIVPTGEMDPESIVTPGAYVDYIVPSEGVNWKWAWE